MTKSVLYNNVNAEVTNLDKVSSLGFEKREAVQLNGKYYQVYVHNSLTDKMKEIFLKGLSLLLLALPYVYYSYTNGWDRVLDKQFLAVPLNLESLGDQLRYQKYEETGELTKGPFFLHQGQRGFLESVQTALEMISIQLNFFKDEVIPTYREEESQSYTEFMMAMLSPWHKFESLENGAGGAHVLVDADGKKLGVLKVNSQDAGSLHNQKHNASIFLTEVRPGIETNQSVINEVLASTIAKELDLEDMTPKAIPVMVRASDFQHNFETKDEYELCSWHPFVQDSVDLASWEGDINHISAQDVEGVNILTWIEDDQDGHEQNYLVYNENDVNRLKKIDGGLVLGDGKKNGFMVNAFSNAKYQSVMDRSLSEEGRNRISGFDVQKVQERMNLVGKSSEAIDSLGKRVRFLQNMISKNPTITLKEIDDQMHAKSKSGWMHLAFG